MATSSLRLENPLLKRKADLSAQLSTIQLGPKGHENRNIGGLSSSNYATPKSNLFSTLETSAKRYKGQSLSSTKLTVTNKVLVGGLFNKNLSSNLKLDKQSQNTILRPKLLSSGIQSQLNAGKESLLTRPSCMQSQFNTCQQQSLLLSQSSSYKQQNLLTQSTTSKVKKSLSSQSSDIPMKKKKKKSSQVFSKNKHVIPIAAPVYDITLSDAQSQNELGIRRIANMKKIPLFVEKEDLSEIAKLERQRINSKKVSLFCYLLIYIQFSLACVTVLTVLCCKQDMMG